MGKPVVHFELYGPNAEGLRSFYADVFDWEVHADESIDYAMIHTNAGNGIDGGIGRGDARVNVVIEVDDLQATLDRVEALGGKTVTPVTEIPGVVTFAEFQDPQGNVLGISLP
jgi:predicted enzyme related to lactoylglutathione lyase